MTTQDCANVINDVVGERIVDDRYFRERIEAGELTPINPHKQPRERYRVTVKEFARYVAAHHTHLLAAVEQRLHLAA